MLVPMNAISSQVEFQALFDSWVEQIRFIECVAIGIPGSPQSTLLYGRVILHMHSRPESSSGRDVETPFLVARHAVYAANRAVVQQLLADALVGLLRWPDGGSCWKAECGDGVPRPDYYPVAHPQVTVDVRLPSVVVAGISRFTLLQRMGGQRELDWKLRGLSRPFYGLEELSIAVGLGPLQSLGDSTRLEVTLLPPITLLASESQILGEHFHVKCQMGLSVSVDDVEVCYRELGPAESSRTGRQVATATEQRDGSHVVMFEGPSHGMAVARVFVSYRGTALIQYWIGDPKRALHARATALRTFDPELRILKQVLLTPSSAQSEDFEAAIAALIHMLGFSVSHLGACSKLTDGPDLLAFTSDGHILVIECTLRGPDNKDKLGKAAQRAASLRDAFSRGGLGVNEVLACVVTPLHDTEVAAFREDGKRKGVLILDNEDLQRLLERLVLPTRSDELFREAKASLAGV